MSLSKRIFITSSIILLVSLLLWGVYLLSFRNTSSSIDKTSLSNTLTDFSRPSSQTTSPIEALTDEAILSPILSATGESIKYYSQTTGKAFELNILTQEKTILSATELINLTGIVWSPNTTKVISRFPRDNASSNFFFYDYSQKKGAALTSGINYIVWQNNNKIVYKYFNSATQEQSLNIADPDGSSWEKIITLPSQDTRIAPIPKTGLVSFWDKPDSFSQSTLQSVPSFGGEVKIVTSGRFGADYLWSEDGSFLLESSVETAGSTKLQLGVMNNFGGEYKNLGIPTVVSKCVWSKNNKNIYYALPSLIPAEAVMPNDYDNAKLNTSDTFWSVNVATGEKTRLVDLCKIA